jgi:hypothetical protein
MPNVLDEGSPKRRSFVLRDLFVSGETLAEVVEFLPKLGQLLCRLTTPRTLVLTMVGSVGSTASIAPATVACVTGQRAVLHMTQLT